MMIFFNRDSITDRRFLTLFYPALVLFLFSLIVNSPQLAYSDFNFDAVGDWGCNSNTDDTVDNIDGRNPVFVFALGDYSYQSKGACWFDRIVPIDSITNIAIGNHEDDDNEGFSGYMTHFGLSNTYYSYNHQNVHVLVMDTDRNSYSSGSSQYNFVVNDLQTASQNPNIKWIIVYLHKQMYTSPNTCGSSSCSNTGTDATNLRNIYHAKFDQYGVDLVLNGHLHNYQRTYPIKYDPGSPSSPTVTDSSSTDYVDPEGEIFATVGTGGISFHALSGKSSFVTYQQDDFFGILDVLITNNGNKLVGGYYTNGGSKLDEFSITKGNSPPVANNLEITTNKNTAKGITLTATDVDNDPLTYTIVNQPAHGTITGGTGASRTYTPNTNYFGPDSFTYKANDGTDDSNTATVNINVQDTTACTTNIPISGVTASGNDGNVPQNVLDNNLATRWSSNGIGQFIRSDLGSIQNICSVDIAWYNGNMRQYHFVIATSTDGTTFSNKFSGDSSGTTLNSEKYVIPATDARYVRITVNGNTANNWASMTELDISGPGSPSSCTTNLLISGVTASGNDGNVPQNVLDNNLATRWSSNGIGQFITSDLGSIQNICSVDIAWYNGNMRQYHFVIATSTDGTTFSNKFSSDSSGTTLNSEKYVIPATDARYVRITVNGNTANNWASIIELDIFGSAFSSATSLYEYAPSLSLSGPS